MQLSSEEFIKILKDAKHGNIDAFEQILHIYEKQIFSYLYRFVNQKEDAEDLTQNTFLKLYKNIKAIDINKNFNAWLYKIATNTAYDWLRKKRRHKELFIEDSNAVETIEDESAYDILDSAYNTEFIIKALNAIKPIYKSILLLFYQDELSYQEISEALSIPINTVKSHLYRAKKSLKEHLTKNI